LLGISHTSRIQHNTSKYLRGAHPKGPSCRHSSGNPIAEIAAIFPTQGPFSHPIPVANETLFAFDNFATAAFALVYAAAQSPSPAAARTGMAKAKEEIIEDLILAPENN
jgi:hypothetical protein